MGKYDWQPGELIGKPFKNWQASEEFMKESKMMMVMSSSSSLNRFVLIQNKNITTSKIRFRQDCFLNSKVVTHVSY